MGGQAKDQTQVSPQHCEQTIGVLTPGLVALPAPNLSCKPHPPGSAKEYSKGLGPLGPQPSLPPGAQPSPAQPGEDSSLPHLKFAASVGRT